MNLLLVAVPRYGAYTMTLTGALLIGASIGYSAMLPKRPLMIVIEGARIDFHLGWCFYLVLIAGSSRFLISSHRYLRHATCTFNVSTLL